MQKYAYFRTEKGAQAACKSLKKAGVNKFRLIHNYNTDTLRYVSNHNPAGLYLGTGTVRVSEIGLVSRPNTTPDALVGLDSYSSFLSLSGHPEGVMLSVDYSPQAEGIIHLHGGDFVNF